MLQDKDHDRVEQIASMLGLRRVGWIFSHPPRAKGIIMTPSEIATAAHMQNTYGEQVVTLILSVNEKGEGNLEAFQVSDQAMRLQSKGAFIASLNTSSPTETAGPESGASASGTKAKLREAVFVEGSLPSKLTMQRFAEIGVEVKVETTRPTPFEVAEALVREMRAGCPFELQRGALRT